MENLNEGKKKKTAAYMAELAEIDKQSAVVAMEAKINHLQEMADKKKAKLKMVSEDENLSELIDPKRKKMMEKEIKEIEKAKAKLESLYEKMSGDKKKDVIDEDDEKMEETYSASSYEEDSIKEDKECDSCGVMHEGSCGSSYEEDDNNPSMEEELNEAESPGKIINKMVQNADKLEKSPEMEKIAAQIAKNPELIKKLNQKVAAAGIPAAAPNNTGPIATELGLGAALGLGGAITGFNLGSTVAYLAGTSIAIGSTVAIGPVLLGAAAGIALGVLAAKVAKKIKGTNEEVDRFKKLAGL